MKHALTGPNIHCERYSQPYRTVARVIARVPPRWQRMVGLRKAARLWFKMFCQPLGPFCSLPDLLLIGASKCGTSSLAAHLSSHPDCLPPFFKEVRYFDSSRVSKLNDYKAHFPTRLRRRAHEWVTGRAALVGDFSPTYFDHPHAPRRAHDLLGANVQLILLLRNPVDRAFSQYRFQKGRGSEQAETFEQALENEDCRLQGEWEKLSCDDQYFSRNVVRYGYVARGRYVEFLRNWHRYFSPEQLHLLRFEDFRDEPQQVFNELCDTLGLSRHGIERKVHNPSQIHESLSPRTRARLIEVFRDSNRDLSDYVGRDFGWDQ